MIGSSHHPDVPSGTIRRMSPVAVSEESSFWYVVRVTYGRELKLKAYLDENGVVSYVPVRIRESRRPSDGKLVRKAVSAVPNMIFIYSTRDFIQKLKVRMENRYPMRYMIDKSTGRPMIVRDKEMTDFIRVTGDAGSDVIWLDNPGVVYEKGQKVTVTGGPFVGVEAYVLRINRDRKVVVTLGGLASAAVNVAMNPQWLARCDTGSDMTDTKE